VCELLLLPMGKRSKLVIKDYVPVSGAEYPPGPWPKPKLYSVAPAKKHSYKYMASLGGLLRRTARPASKPEVAGLLDFEEG
jgi:hypothetical protein